MKTALTYLRELEKSGLYVFHGSLDLFDCLEPRQAHTLNKETGEMEEDGEPAVFATPFLDIALFRALMNRKDVEGPSESSFDYREGRLYFSATDNIRLAAEHKRGKIYILPKETFVEYDVVQLISPKKVIPFEVIEITMNDLHELFP